MGALASDVTTRKEEALDNRIVDDGLEDHTHKAGLSHVEETSGESSSTGQRGRVGCNVLVPFRARVEVIQLPLLVH